MCTNILQISRKQHRPLFQYSLPSAHKTEREMADMKYFCSKDKAYHKGPGAYQHQQYVADMVKLPLTVLHPAYSTNVYNKSPKRNPRAPQD